LIQTEGTYTGLKTTDGEILFSCKTALGGHHTCVWDKKIKERIQGKHGTVLWYKMPVFLWIQRDRLVELWVDNEKIVSREKTQSRFDHASKFAFWELPCLFFMFIGVDFFFKRLVKRRIKE